MSTWSHGVITSKGDDLQAKMTAGTPLILTRVVTGTGYVPATLLKDQTAVSGEKQTIAFGAPSYPDTGVCKLPVKLENEGLEAEYIAKQIGIYAEDPDEGEVLFCISQVSTNNDGMKIPAADESPGYCAEFNYYFEYGQADGVSVTVDKANSVSRAEMEDYISEEFVSITIEEIDAEFAAEETKE